MTTNGLGRREEYDPRNENYLVRKLFLDQYGGEPTGATYRYWWENGAWYDQGATGTCVGHGWAHEIEDAPHTHPDELVDPYDIYDLATTLDPWGDNDHDVNAGTSVLAGAKAAKQLGFVSTYYWASPDRTLYDVQQAVLYHGPVVLGTVWTQEMFDPPIVRRHSLLGIKEVSTEPIGGHCYVLNGVNMETGIFRLKNSWGRGWADSGHCRITFQAVEYLLALDGEACVPTDV